MECHEPANIYHEKQSKQMCALHTLNNLFQKPTFTKTQLDDICENLSPQSWINPHRSMIGLGNYDINVLMAALQSVDCDLSWWDKRKEITTNDIKNALGFILNLPSQSRVGGLLFPFKTKHWLAIRQFGSDYYNLDSKLDCPQIIGDSVQLSVYLTKHLNIFLLRCLLFIIMQKYLLNFGYSFTLLDFHV
nr:EOG090X0HOM [Eurycercus lamellatus]